MLHRQKVLLHKEHDEFWLMGYRVRHPAYHPHRTHLSSLSKGRKHGSMEVPLYSDYEAPFQTNGDVVSDPNIDVDIPSMQRENFHRKNFTRNLYLQTSH
jgi:hypothetical protein